MGSTHNSREVTHESFIRRTTTCFAMLAFVSVACPAFAEDAPTAVAVQTETPSGDATVSEVVWYGPTVGLLYGLGYAGTGLGYYLIFREPVAPRVVGAILMPVGAITTVFGPMLAHFDHGSLGKGLLSVGGQVAGVVVGVAAGYTVATIAGADEPGTAMLIGGLSGHASWALFDTLFLAREERVLERTTSAPSYALTLDPRGVRASMGFRF